MSTATQCEEDNLACPDGVDAEFIDLTGLDGCSWLLELEDGTRLEPVNLNDFEIEPQEGLKVEVSYKEVEMFSTCMAGLIVELSCIEKR